MNHHISALILFILIGIFIYAAVIAICKCIGGLMIADSELHNWKQCSWCKCWMNDGGTQIDAPAGVDLTKISHGICPDCLEKELETLERLAL